MYYAVVNQQNQFLITKGQQGLVFGSIDRAAKISDETKGLWEGLYPGITALIESKQVALIAHPNYRCIGINEQGFEVYEVDGDPNDLVIGDAAFDVATVAEDLKQEEAPSFSID